MFLSRSLDTIKLSTPVDLSCRHGDIIDPRVTSLKLFCSVKCL